MIAHDEETPLLHSERHGKKKTTPLPWFQFSITLFLQLAEPLTSQVIYPFMPEVCTISRNLWRAHSFPGDKLIRDLGVTHGNESQVGYYVGMMVSLDVSILS